MDDLKTTAPMGPGGPPPEGGPGPGGPVARLGKEYTFEILAPAGVPVKQLHIDLSSMTAVLDTEHGSQDVLDFKLEKDIFSFRAMLGSGGDELFEVWLATTNPEVLRCSGKSSNKTGSGNRLLYSGIRNVSRLIILQQSSPLSRLAGDCFCPAEFKNTPVLVL